MSEVKEHSVIYLAPTCHEEHMQREWCEDDVWCACEECGSGDASVRYNLGADFDRVTAERDAALGLSVTKIMLDIVPGYDGMGEEVYAKSVEDVEHAFTKLYDEVERLTDQRDALQQRLTAADERADVLEADVREKECLLCKCMEAFNNCVGMASQNARMKWYEAYLKPVSGSVLVHFSKGIQRALDEPAECDDTTIEEEREDAKKVFIRTNTKQGQNVSLADMLSRYETKL